MFYYTRCKQYYLFSEGIKPKKRIRLVAPSGLSISITSGAVTKNPVKKKGAKVVQPVKKEQKEKQSETVKKTTVKKKAKHKAIIEKNVTNPDNGQLKNIGKFSSTEPLEKKINTSGKKEKKEKIDFDDFFEWTSEDTEEELFKDFIHEE